MLPGLVYLFIVNKFSILIFFVVNHENSASNVNWSVGNLIGPPKIEIYGDSTKTWSPQLSMKIVRNTSNLLLLDERIEGYQIDIYFFRKFRIRICNIKI